MKFTTKDVTQGVTILANDHYVAIPYDCSKITATNGVIKAGTIIPSMMIKQSAYCLMMCTPQKIQTVLLLFTDLLKRQNCLLHRQ